MRLWILSLLTLSLAPALPAVTPYQYGQLPSVASDADLTSAYNTWKTRRLRSITCGQSMLWVDNGSSQAFSEGQAYGLLMAAYLDANSADFTRLWRFYELKDNSRGLMNWRVPGDCGGDNGANAATDADLDAAIALIRAQRRWPAEGWGAKATTLLNNIYTHMIDGCQGIKNGDTWGGCSSGANDAYNPSYFRTGYMASFNCFEGSSRWTAVRNRSYQVANHSYNNYALPPDWVRNDGTWGRATNSGGYGYDSCRSPWTFVQDYLWWGNATGQNWGRKIGNVFGNKAGGWGNPASAASDVGDDYSYSTGAKVRNNHENAFIGGAAVAFMATTHTAQLNAFYNELKFTDNNSYYSDSLKVLYLMILTGNFQEPCYGPGPIPTATPTSTPTPYAGTPTQTPMPAFGLVFEDFENGISGNYGYPAAVQSAQSRSAAAAHAGAYGYNVGPANLASGGVGFNSSYANGQGIIDATGAVSLRFWVKADVNTTFQVDWYEGGATGAPVAGGDGEAWVSGNVNVSGGSGWQQIVLPIASMTEELYNGACNPSYLTPGPCGTVGNGVKNLSSVKQIQIKFTLGTAATVQFDDFEFVLGTQPSPTFTRTPFIGSYNQVFDDMESPLSLNQAVTPKMAGGYADTANGATATVGTTTTELAPGGGSNTTSGVLAYNSGGAASYGAGGFLLSPYGTDGLYVDASGAVFLGLWINANAGTAYRIAFQEAGTPTSPTAGAEGEAWQSSLLVASGGWEFVQLEVGAFSEDIYNPVCNPTSATPGPCGSTGDNLKDFQAIASVTLKLDGNQGAGNFYFDDVVFVTTFKTPTPTRSPSPAPSPTRTRTPTASPTASPSASPSPTDTVQPSGTPTPTVSPSETPFAGSPTDTPPATPSSTLTLTYSPVDTATLTHTPQPGTPTYTVQLTATFTPPAATATHTPLPPSPTHTPAAPSPTHTPLPGSPTFTAVVPSATFSPTNVPAATFTATRTQTPLPSATSTPVSAMITDLAFAWSPNQLTVTAGTNVTWAWVGTHDLRSDTGLFNSGAAVAGGSFNYTFNTPGTYRYYCSLHGGPGGIGMSGIIYVTGGAPTATAVPTPVQTGSDAVIVGSQPFPNPVRTGGSVRVLLNGPVESLSFDIYTPAMVLVSSLSLGAKPGGWVDIALPASFVGQPAGPYFYVVRGKRHGVDVKPRSGRLVLLH